MKSPFVDQMYNIRVLVFVETDPQSDEYEQLDLTYEQYLQVLDAIERIACEIDENGIAVPVLDEDPVQIPNRNSYA